DTEPSKAKLLVLQLLSAAIDDFEPIAIRVADEADERAAFADAVRLPFRLDPLPGELRERGGEVVDADGDVAVASAEVVGAPVVVVRQLEHRGVVAEREEVVRRLELAIADDVHVALEAEAERPVEGAALLRIRDPDHRVEEFGHARILRARSSLPAWRRAASPRAPRCRSSASASGRWRRDARPSRRSSGRSRPVTGTSTRRRCTATRRASA